MADGFYTNDDDDAGCFGGYGSDGAWAYAAGDDDFGASGRSASRPAVAPGGFGTTGSDGPPTTHSSSCNGGDYGRAA